MDASKGEDAAMAHAVIAEGVQTQQQASRLQALGCGLGQGYYFNRSLPSKGVRMLLQSACRLGRLAL